MLLLVTILFSPSGHSLYSRAHPLQYLYTKHPYLWHNNAAFIFNNKSLGLIQLRHLTPLKVIDRSIVEVGNSIISQGCVCSCLYTGHTATRLFRRYTIDIDPGKTYANSESRITHKLFFGIYLHMMSDLYRFRRHVLSVLESD